MVSPVFLLGAVALGAYLLKSSAAKSSGPPSTVDALIDPSEKLSPHAPNARFQMAQAMATNSYSQMMGTASAIETGMRMPKTAANLRAWAEMAKAGGSAVAGVLQRARRKESIPDWLKFQATQSRLTGDPKFIRATAETLRRYGYRRAAEIHLSQIE